MVIMTSFLQERLMLCVMGYMTAQVALDARLLATGGGTTEAMKELIAKQMGL